jgi:hypothetical protein
MVRARPSHTRRACEAAPPNMLRYTSIVAMVEAELSNEASVLVTAPAMAA